MGAQAGAGRQHYARGNNVTYSTQNDGTDCQCALPLGADAGATRYKKADFSRGMWQGCRRVTRSGKITPESGTGTRE